jgi:adenine-specific DNA methylase
MRTYADLFNDRQLLHLTLLGHRIRATQDRRLKQLLVLAFSEHLTANCMYTGYAYGYRRTCALFSLHGYRHVVRPVEINPWLIGIGRGTFPNVVRKIARAIVYAQAPTDLKHARGMAPIGPVDGVVSPDPQRVIHGQCYAAIKTQSSTDLSTLPDGVVHIVLTDPPYFDNISYSELSDFYLAWQQQLQTLEPPYNNPKVVAPIRENLAITARAPHALERYGHELTLVLRECARVLHAKGICVFTYHHSSEDAWLLLGQALAASGLRCTGVVPMRGEGQGGLHTKAGTIKWDAVLVCRKADRAQPHHSELFVTPEIFAEARAIVQRYVQLFAKEEDVAFRPPDQRNLFRALLVTQAFVSRRPSLAIPLRTALSLSFQPSPRL